MNQEKLYKYHCILSMQSKGTVMEENWGKLMIGWNRECEDWIMMTEREFEEYKKPGKATNGWHFVKLIDKEEWKNDN